MNIGDWYIPQAEYLSKRLRGPRRILAIGNNRVLYSNGGSRHYERTIRTFHKWIKRTGAEIANPNIERTIDVEAQ